MKKKLSGFLTASAIVFISTSSFAQLNVGVSSATKATTSVNTAAVNNAVSKTTQATTAATNNAVTKATHVSGTAVAKVNNARPHVSANANAKSQGKLNVSNDNNSNASSHTDATVDAGVSTKNTTNEVTDTKTQVKDGLDKTKAKGKNQVKKLRRQNHGLEVSTEAKTQGEIKRQNR